MPALSSITGMVASPANTTLQPSGPNPAAQLTSAPSAGPGVGGAATVAGVQAAMPQQQQPAAPMQPQQPGFRPNPQGQVVYPPGQGPVTSQVAPMKLAALSPFAQGFLATCQSRGLSVEQTRDQLVKASQISGTIAQELEPLLKEAIGLGKIFGKVLGKVAPKAIGAVAPEAAAATAARAAGSIAGKTRRLIPAQAGAGLVPRIANAGDSGLTLRRALRETGHTRGWKYSPGGGISTKTKLPTPGSSTPAPGTGLGSIHNPTPTPRNYSRDGNLSLFGPTLGSAINKPGVFAQNAARAARTAAPGVARRAGIGAIGGTMSDVNTALETGEYSPSGAIKGALGMAVLPKPMLAAGTGMGLGIGADAVSRMTTGHAIPGLEGVGGAAGLGAMMGLPLGVGGMLPGKGIAGAGMRAIDRGYHGMGQAVSKGIPAGIRAGGVPGVAMTAAGAVGTGATVANAAADELTDRVYAGAGEVFGDAALARTRGVPAASVPAAERVAARNATSAAPAAATPPAAAPATPGAPAAPAAAPTPPGAPAAPATPGAAAKPPTPPAAVPAEKAFGAGFTADPAGFIANHWKSMDPKMQALAFVGLLGLIGGGLSGNRGIGGLGLLAMLAGVLSPQLMGVVQKHMANSKMKDLTRAGGSAIGAGLAQHSSPFGLLGTAANAAAAGAETLPAHMGRGLAALNAVAGR